MAVLCFCPPVLSILPLRRVKTQVSTPEPAQVLSAHPCEGCVGPSTPVVLHPPLLPTSWPILWPRAALFCPPFLPPLVSWLYLVYVYVFFTGLSPSFCLVGTAFSAIFLLCFYASYIQIAQYITKYHPVTPCHTHLLLLLFEAAALCKQGGG